MLLVPSSVVSVLDSRTSKPSTCRSLHRYPKRRRALFVESTGVSVRPACSDGDDSRFLYGNYNVGPASGIPIVTVDTGDRRDTVTGSYNIVAGGGTGTNRLNLLGNQFAVSSFSFFQ